MKKIFLISILFSLILEASNKKMVRVDLKANTEIGNEKKGKIWFEPYLKFTAFDLKLTSIDSKWEFKTVLKGNRALISRPDKAFIYKNENIINGKYEPKIVEGEENFFGEKSITETYYGTDYKYTKNLEKQIADRNSIEQFIFKNPSQVHEHDHHDHEHTHEHTHEHEHKHEENEEEENRNEINIIRPRILKQISETNDGQFKASVRYFDGKNGFKYTQYISSFNENDEDRKFAGDAIFEGINTNVFNNKYSLSFRPRFYTRKIINPLALEMDTDVRYKHNEDMTMGAYIYNGIQLESIKERLHFKNHFELFFDKNKELKRMHKFYEIVNHEHEKLEQIRLSASLTHEGNYLYNQFYVENTPKFDEMKDKYKFSAQLKLKKSDLFIKGLSVENDLNIIRNYATHKNSTKVYKVENASLKFIDPEDEHYIYKGKYKGKDVFNPAAANEEILRKIYKTDKGYELHKVYETTKELRNDFSGEIKKKKIKYLEKSEYIPDYISGKEMITDDTKTKNNMELKNKTKIVYNKFSIENKLKFNKLLDKTQYLIKNESKLAYEQDIMKFKLKPYIENEYNIFKNTDKDYYETNKFSPAIDVAYNFVYDITDMIDIAFKLGLDSKFSLQSRKASSNRLQTNVLDEKIKNKVNKLDFERQKIEEENKWVQGSEINIRPYAEFITNIGNDLSVKLSGEMNLKYEKGVFTNYLGGYSPKSKIWNSNYKTKLKLALEYHK